MLIAWPWVKNTYAQLQGLIVCSNKLKFESESLLYGAGDKRFLFSVDILRQFVGKYDLVYVMRDENTKPKTLPSVPKIIFDTQ